jgi:hypothetical protein
MPVRKFIEKSEMPEFVGCLVFFVMEGGLFVGGGDPFQWWRKNEVDGNERKWFVPAEV